MRKSAIVALFLCLFSVTCLAAELNTSKLQGKWLITEFMGEPDSEGDMWEFEENRFYQVLGGRRISPDAFTTAPGVIDLDYAEITVHSFDGKSMEATFGGARYKLVKQ